MLSLNASISSQAELDAWLASLLDNTTGGLNGSLVDVTGELPTLGLNAVVTAALANETWASSGVFGDPISIATTTFVALGGGTHPSFSFSFLSFFLGLWNTVSGAVLSGLILAARAVEGLLATLWNAAVAAVRYLEAIGHALARFAESVVAATVTELKKVGGALLQALDVLLTLVKNEVISLLTVALKPVIDTVHNYAQTLVADLTAISQAGSSVPPSDVSRFWEDAGGNVFLALLGMAAVVEIAITVASVLSLGSDFLFTDLATVLITIAITAVVAISSVFLQGLSNWGAAAVHSLEDLLNTTTSSPGGPLTSEREPIAAIPFSSCAWQGAWDAFATTFGSLADVFTAFTLGPALLAGALFGVKKLSQNDITGRVVDLAAGILAVLVDVVGLFEQASGDLAAALFLEIWGTFLGAGAFVLDKILEKTEFEGPLKTLDLLSDILDGVGVAIGGGTVVIDTVICGGP